MFISEIWRYPVKSMGGERLESCTLTADGVPGDRVVHVKDARGRLVTSRTQPRLLLHRARLGRDGEPRVDDRPWRDQEVAADVARAAGPGAHLSPWRGPERFDVLPLLVATDGALACLGQTARRFRPNIVIGGVSGLAERTWAGRRLALGDVLVTAVQMRHRCIMVTFDPDTAEQDVEILHRIHRELDGTFALDCRVERGGPIREGDPVRLLGDAGATADGRPGGGPRSPPSAQPP
jgi:uncharacterized protein YcbX